MLQGIVSTLSSAYVEIIILFFLLIAFVMHRRDPRLVVSGIRIVRTLLVVLIFFYFMFIWASTVQPTLRSISVFGMFLVNLFMLYNLVLARLERPYRDALGLITKEPEKHELIHNVWHTGKRFYYLRYAWSSLFSGANPLHYLHDLATERVRDDIKDILRHYGVEQKMITVPVMAGFLKSQIACDQTMPADFKDVMVKAIDDFSQHPWIQERGNEFLRLATERPEDLHFPEWMASFDACVKTYKSKEPV
ncbi:MAG: hypothetical protein NTY36_10490 [Deltaproteobacteria bacterium]|nr:hypothetical protein [Deltaproteobacteria bacterium]